MKERILSALKTKYNNLGFSKAFDGVADYLSKTVTKDEDIETATAGVEILLKAFQGDIDKVRSEKTTLQKQYEKLHEELKAKAEGAAASTTPQNQTQQTQGSDTDIDSKIAAALAAQVKPLQEKLSAYETKAQQDQFQSKILSKAKELKIPEWRIKEGFSISNDSDDDTINNVLSTIKQNLVTAGLEGKRGFSIDPNVKPSTDQIDAILDRIQI